jgi:hypothetical protein
VSVDVLEAAFDIGIQDVLVLAADVQMDSQERIVAGATRAEAVAVRFEARFPLWLQREAGQGLVGSIEQHRNTQGPELVGLAGLGDEHATDRLRRDGCGCPQAFHEQQTD